MPQTYIRTLPASMGLNDCFSRASVLKIFKLLIGLEVNGSLVRSAWGVAPVLGVYQGDVWSLCYSSTLLEWNVWRRIALKNLRTRVAILIKETRMQKKWIALRAGLLIGGAAAAADNPQVSIKTN